MDELYNPDEDSETDGSKVSVRSTSEQSGNQAAVPHVPAGCNCRNSRGEGASDAGVEISRLQIEAFARPRLFDELMETVNSPEMEGVERSLGLVHELPEEVLSCLFEEHI